MPGSSRGEGVGVSTRTRGRPSLEEAAQIDRELLDAARDMFFAHGYERTSMAMIIKAAGVSKTTLYARYADKAALFRASARYTIETIANDRLTTGRKTDDLELGLTTYGYDAIKISTSDVWLNFERLAFAEGIRFPELIEALGDRVGVGVRNVSAFIRDCAERDGIPCRDPDAVATVYVMAVRGYYTAAVLRSEALGEAECRAYIDTLVGTLIHGRATW